MTIASLLGEIRASKEAIRQAIIEKGVDVPETELIDTYAGYIDQISGGGGSPTGDGTLADLKLALSTDNPAEYYPIGTELPDTYAGNSNPLIVAQYLNSSNNSSYGGAEGVILVRKYVEPTGQAFGNTVEYSNSTIRSFLDTTYLSNCSDSLKANINNISVIYSSTTVSGKWFLMSGIEVGGTHNSGEGFFWDYWKQKTGLSSASNNNNSGRILRDRGGTAQYVWLRSKNGILGVYEIFKTGNVDVGTPTASDGVLPACFIGKD